MKVASISELKDGLSAHLELVRAGEMVVVTARKAPVATLQRIEPGVLGGDVEKLVAGGVVAPRREKLAVEGFLSMPLGGCRRENLSAAVLEEREEGR